MVCVIADLAQISDGILYRYLQNLMGKICCNEVKDYFISKFEFTIPLA